MVCDAPLTFGGIFRGGVNLYMGHVRENVQKGIIWYVCPNPYAALQVCVAVVIWATEINTQTHRDRQRDRQKDSGRL